MLKNKAQQTEKNSKNDSQMNLQKGQNFGGNASWGAFGGPNRFCDEKVGSQRSQRVLKDGEMSQK